MIGEVNIPAPDVVRISSTVRYFYSIIKTKTMKNILYLLFILLTIGMANAQTANYEEIISKKEKGKLTTYISQSGEEFKVGDTITIGLQ